MSATSAARHRPSHTGLLHAAPPPAVLTGIDAIVVPTARPPAYLRNVLRLSVRLRCPVLALCSKWASAEGAHREAERIGAHLIAANLRGDIAVPASATAAVLQDSRLEKLLRRSDLSLKRNVGLAVARMAGWSRIVFLDDDITGVEPDHLRAAATLLDDYRMVGLENSGFPDNSVVCHALRKVRAYQGSFVGGGAMAVPADRTTSYFPNIYNEDWFFLIGERGLSPTAVTGKVEQKWYDPFRTDERARAEEFGDCLAEGIYALLDDGHEVGAANATYWSAFLADRRALIDEVLAAIPRLDLPGREQERMTAAMKAARGRGRLVTPELCVNYLSAWQTERGVWQAFLEVLPRLTVGRALAHLGVTDYRIHRPARQAVLPPPTVVDAALV